MPSRFWELDPRRLRDLKSAAAIQGAARFGRAVDPRDMPHVDLVVARRGVTCAVFTE
jgi:hypothetical protein